MLQDANDSDADNGDDDPDSDHDGGSGGAIVTAEDDCEEDDEAANDSDLVMLSDTEVMDGETHPFQVLLDEEAEAASGATAPASGVERSMSLASLDQQEDSQVELETKKTADGHDLFCIEDSPPRSKNHTFGSPSRSSPYRKFKELSAKLRLLKLKQSQRSSGSVRKDCIMWIRLSLFLGSELVSRTLVWFVF